MTRMVNMHEAKTQLSKLVAAVVEGEEVVIAKAGKPVAKLVMYREAVLPRELGLLRGQIKILPGFDEMDEEIADLFEGKESGPY
jgi:prevent-host-death family protein